MSLSLLLVLGLLGFYLYTRGHAGVVARHAADPDAAPLEELARAGSDLGQPHEICLLYTSDAADE